MTAFDVKNCLSQLWHAGIAEVSGQHVVTRALRNDPTFEPDLVISVGKAASSMCMGALSSLPGYGKAIVVTKVKHAHPALSRFPNVRVIEAGHPIPDENSLRAGKLILRAVREQPLNEKLLFLLSGGASALVEVLADDMRLSTWQERTQHMLAGGMSIDEINNERKETSLIKGGKLLEEFHGAEVRVYAISDVQGDDIGVIGSGLGNGANAPCVVTTRIVGCNAVARDGAANAALAVGLPVRSNEESLYGDVFELAPRIAKTLCKGRQGVYIWGGEPTIRLPAKPGNGGRNQSLALAIAKGITGRGNITVLVAGTDGTDGPTEAAGAIIDGDTFDTPNVAERALAAADAGSYLQHRGKLFMTGPTNTNVMDLVVAIVE